MRKPMYTAAGFTFLCLLSVQLSFAQSGNIQGKVNDEKGNPLTGATVSLDKKTAYSQTPAEIIF